MAEPQSTEQITAPIKEEAPVKIKDPRKVAAGKALAARNKAAREAKSLRDSQNSVGGFSFDGVLQVAAVVGAGFTLYHGYQVVKSLRDSQDSARRGYERPVETVYTKPKPATPPNSPQPACSASVKNDIKGIDME